MTPTNKKSWAGNLLMLLDLTFGSSFKVKQWFTGFGELSFQWIRICICSPMRRSSFLYVYTDGMDLFTQMVWSETPTNPMMQVMDIVYWFTCLPICLSVYTDGVDRDTHKPYDAGYGIVYWFTCLPICLSVYTDGVD